MQSWLHGGDPLEPLRFEKPLRALKAAIAKGGYFEGLIKKYMLDNPHRVTVVLAPDKNLREREEATERARLDAARAAMTPAEIKQVIKQTRELKAMQEKPDSAEALATIPMLKLGGSGS